MDVLSSLAAHCAKLVFDLVQSGNIVIFKEFVSDFMLQSL